MKRSFALLIILSLALTGCRTDSQQCDIVKETYIHKYGVPITKMDWDSQGKDGQVVSLRADGVSVSTSYLGGIIHGPTTYTFPNTSTIQTIETYCYGELISKKEHFASGVPVREERFKKGDLSDLTLWYEDGTPKLHEIYEGDYLVTGEYRTPLNVIESKIQEGEGTRVCRSSEGDLLTKDLIINGQMVERINYFRNGDPSVITPFKNHKIHGTRLTFCPGGIPQTVEQWADGLQEGVTIVYQNGEKLAEVPYVKGKKHGVEARYREGTLLVEEISWKDDVQHGQHKLIIDGHIKSDWYHQGNPVSQSIFERLNIR